MLIVPQCLLSRELKKKILSEFFFFFLNLANIFLMALQLQTNWMTVYRPVDTGRKLNEHKDVQTRPMYVQFASCVNAVVTHF